MHAGLTLLCFAITALVALAPPALWAQEPAAAPPSPPTPASPGTPAMKRAMEWKQFEYTCEGGAKLRVYLHNATVKVVFKDKVYLMRQTLSADGGRYSDGKMVWWSKGNGGFLQVDAPDGNGDMIVKGCELDQPPSAESLPSLVSGTVSYMVRMALPPSAVIELQLQDVSRADAPATMIAEETITLGNRQAPVSFELKFDPAKIDPGHTYAVGARILVDGQLRFINDKSYAVLTRGNPVHVALQLKPVAPAPAAKS
jgi:uncharacterized lipoprotein YbaY/membrane-bound inhibitor of C-type lysozyme